MVLELRPVVPERITRPRAGAAGVFPLGLGRQAIARPTPVRDLHFVTVDLVERPQAFPLAQGVAEPHGVEPGDALHRVLVGGLARDRILASARAGESTRVLA